MLRLFFALTMSLALAGCAAESGRLEGPGFTGGYVGVSGGFGATDPGLTRR